MKDKPEKKPKRIGLLAFFGITLISVIGFFLFLSAAGAFLITADPLEKSEAVVLLSGGDEKRMDEAVRIYQEKFASTIILTETGENVKGYNTQYSKEQRDVLLEKGIPLGAIEITEKPAASTRGEAKVVKTLVNNKRVHSLIIVTNSYHSLRTRLVFRDVFKDTEIKILVQPVRGSWYRSMTWWLSPQGWEATVSEYVKLGAYFLEKSDN